MTAKTPETKFPFDNDQSDDISRRAENNDHDCQSPDQSEEPQYPKRKRTPPPEGMTISAFKRLKRQQKWEAGKADRKAKKKESDKLRKQQRREAIASGQELPLPPKPSTGKPVLVPISVVIDCGFDDLMFEQEIKSLASQITRCYSDNSKARFRVHLGVSGFDKRLKERFDTVLEGQYKGWKGIRFYGEDFVEVAGQMGEVMGDVKTRGFFDGALLKSGLDSQAEEAEGEVVYLSSESPNTITELTPGSTYIIGGLVDRNRHKGLCYKRACDRGIKTAKLPIGEFMEMNSRKVLATNHVCEIMLRWLESGNWGEAFEKVIPKRKGGVLKGQKDEKDKDDADGQGHDEDGEDEDDVKRTEDILDGQAGEAEEKAELAKVDNEVQGATDGLG